jgi:ribonuclease T2
MRLLSLVFVCLFTAFAATAESGSQSAGTGGNRADTFDYYVMSLSWSPNWCATTGDARRDPQCDAGLGLTFVLHGLWPQFEQGYPANCATTNRDPSRDDTARMADVMGGAGLAFYQWKKHGRCSGLTARAYFATLRRAYASIMIPPVFAHITTDITAPAHIIEDAFIEANPALRRDQITVTCNQNLIQEVRICLTKDLTPRTCGPDVIRDCTLPRAELDAVR